MYNDPLLYEQGFSIHVNDEDSPLYFYFDYDFRSNSINMDFQHFHNFYEVFILLDEKASHIIEGDHYDVSQYDIVILKPFQQHKSKYHTATTRRLIINFAIPKSDPSLQESIDEVFRIFDADIPIYRFSDEILNSIHSIVNEIFIIGKEAPPLKDFLIYNKFMEFLYTIYRHKGQNKYVQQPLNDSITRKVYAITGFIHANYAEELSLESLAKRIYVSSHYLSHQFKKVTGFTLINYIQIVRVKNAQQYLLYTNMRISDISERCGFTSFSHFNRVFSKFCHVSPSEFRANGRLG